MDANFVSSIRRLPSLSRYQRSDVLSGEFSLFKDDRIEVFYAPLDWFNPSAKVAVIGITPGWRQTEIAFRVARHALLQGAPVNAAAQQAKEAARFAGPMRNNLIAMLDVLRLPDALGLSSSVELFEGRSELLHSTSAMRYPVFMRGNNYSGYSPKPRNHSYLNSMVDTLLTPEIEKLRGTLLIPLGRTVDELVTEILSSHPGEFNCLHGFPHPSGANAHRASQFAVHAGGLTDTVRRWSEGL